MEEKDSAQRLEGPRKYAMPVFWRAEKEIDMAPGRVIHSAGKSSCQSFFL